MEKNKTTKPATNAVSSNRLFEYFCDESYYHLWCVRPSNERRWGHCYHVQSKDEAQGLAEELSQLELLRSAGWIAHAKNFEQCVRTLRVIHTWASVDGALIPEHVKKQTSKALKPFMPNSKAGN